MSAGNLISRRVHLNTNPHFTSHQTVKNPGRRNFYEAWLTMDTLIEYPDGTFHFSKNVTIFYTFSFEMENISWAVVGKKNSTVNGQKQESIGQINTFQRNCSNKTLVES